MCPWSSDFEVLYEGSIQLWLNISLLNIIVNSLRCVPSSPITTALRIRCYIKQYPLVDMFLSSHCPSWKCIDVIRGNFFNSLLNLLLFPILHAVCHISLTNITLRITHYIKQYPLIDNFFFFLHIAQIENSLILLQIIQLHIINQTGSQSFPLSHPLRRGTLEMRSICTSCRRIIAG